MTTLSLVIRYLCKKKSGAHDGKQGPSYIQLGLCEDTTVHYQADIKTTLIRWKSAPLHP